MEPDEEGLKKLLRELSSALTHLETAVMFANAAIARQGDA